MEDESRLRRIAAATFSPAALWASALALLALFVAVGAMIVMLTPLRTLLPGYLKQGERTATEEGLLRIDSIRDAYESNSRYLSSILAALDTDRIPEDTLKTDAAADPLPPDSLLPASPREIEYISQMQDREKYNLTVLAPLAAEQLQTYPAGPGAVFSQTQTENRKARIIMPKGSPVCAVADGRVLAVQNPAPEGGSALVMQHDHGFASRYSHLGSVSVKAGDHVDGGAAIALGARGGAVAPGWILLEMWHDGVEVEPSRYIQM